MSGDMNPPFEPEVSPLNCIVRYSEFDVAKLIGPPAVLLHDALVSAQALPSSTWKIPFVSCTLACVSCQRQLAVLLQAVVIVGEDVL